MIAVDAPSFERLGPLLGGRFDDLRVRRAADDLGPAPDEAEDLARVAAVVAQAVSRVDEIALRRPTLDDAFLALTGHPAHEETDPNESPRT